MHALTWISTALIGAVYLLLLPQNFTEAEDAVYYLDHVAGGAVQWHGNHLLFEPLNALWLGLLRLLSPGIEALLAMQLLSLIAALSSLGLLARLARVSGGSDMAVLVVIWLSAGSFGFWLYAGYPDTYLLPLPFMLAALLAEMTERAPWQVALWAALAALLHQQHVFLLPALLAAMLLRGQLERALAVTACWLVLVLGSYATVSFAILGHETLSQTLSWARGFADDGLWTPLSIVAPIKALIGLGTAIWSSGFLFAHEGLAEALARVFEGRELSEELFFARTGLLGGFGLLAALTLVSVISWLALGLSALHRAQSGAAGRLLGLAAISYALAVTIWEPTNKEFWIAVLPLLLLWISLRLDFSRRAIQMTAAMAVLTLWLANGLGALWGFSQSETDYWRVENADLFAIAEPGDVIVDHCGYICTGYLLAFSEAELLPAEALPRAAETGPGRILITGRAMDQLQDQAPEAANLIEGSTHPEIYQLAR